MTLPFMIVDADHHYYEPYDCFTRYLDPAFRERAVHRKVWEKDGLGRIYWGEERIRFAAIWPMDYATKPGALMTHFGSVSGSAELTTLMPDPIDPKNFPEFYDYDARIKLMDEQNVQAIIMQPSLAIAFEPQMADDVPCLYAHIEAYNKWLRDDWGWGRQGRIYSAAWLSMVDPERAVKELDRLLAEGVRTVYMKSGPVAGRSPADPVFDPIWARLAEARIPVNFHTGNSGYAELFSDRWNEDGRTPLHKMSMLQFFQCVGERPVVDTLAALVLGGLFERFPQLRILSVENGAYWVSSLLHGMDKAYKFSFGRTSFGTKISRLPSETFRENIWVAPFWEDNIPELISVIGVDRVLCGSDFPHGEGTETPEQFGDPIKDLDPLSFRKVMRGNCAELLGLAP